jgi:NTP pyrophosphatase (non-canonical NTP hydrolase)
MIEIEILLCFLIFQIFVTCPLFLIFEKGYKQSLYMSDLKEIIDALIAFRDERDWEQFHNSKDLALAISIEAAELNELFLWKKAEEVNVEKLKTELADVLAYSLILAKTHNLDVKQIVLDKIKANAEKYPVDKAKGNAKKYNEL